MQLIHTHISQNTEVITNCYDKTLGLQLKMKTQCRCRNLRYIIAEFPSHMIDLLPMASGKVILISSQLSNEEWERIKLLKPSNHLVKPIWLSKLKTALID